MSEHDPIETLLKATGRRPAVPADRMERVREAASARWRHELAQRTRRRRAGWWASLAAAAVVVAALGLAARGFRPSAAQELTGVRVDRVANTAWARRGSLPFLRTVLELGSGSMIPKGFDVTTAAGARLGLRTPTGHSLRLDSDTTLLVLSNRDFVLRRGTVYVDADERNRDRTTSIRIGTPVGTIEDRGTQFEARWDGGALVVRVREGGVTIRSVAGTVDANAGDALRLDRSGGVDRTDLAASGADWRWTETIAPMMTIEGRSLREFLDWVARERGVTLRFADGELAGRSGTIVLRGSIAGMTIDQATASVLATCGLAHRWDGESLSIEPAAAENAP